VAILPAFHTLTDSARYGANATDVYHDRSECSLGKKILLDGNGELGQGGRRRCAECRNYETV
jgi:hypothetical protein